MIICQIKEFIMWFDIHSQEVKLGYKQVKFGSNWNSVLSSTYQGQQGYCHDVVSVMCDSENPSVDPSCSKFLSSKTTEWFPTKSLHAEMFLG